MSTEQFIKISKTKWQEILNAFHKADIKSDATCGKINILESILSEGQPVEQISDEDIERMAKEAHFKEFGCNFPTNYHWIRGYKAAIQTVDSTWLTEKPTFNKECLFVTATLWPSGNDYRIWQTIKVNTEDGPYMGLFVGNGDEWGDLADLQADRYKIISPINNDK